MEEGSVGVVKGHVVFPQSPALPPGAVLTITLADVSRADAPAQILARQIIAPPGEPPIPFVLGYDPDSIVPNHTYAVRARVEDSERLLFISANAYHVITHGAPTELEVKVDPIGQPPARSST